MNSTSVNSSKTSKEVKHNSIRIVGGPLNIVEKGKDYAIEMNPEYLIDFSTPMMDLAKSVGNFTGYLDENGKIIKRVDNKTGKEFVVKMPKEDRVSIVAIDDKKIRNAKKALDNNKVSKSER